MTAPDADRDPADDPGPVHVHVHRAVTGAFPLRVADLLFTDDRLLVPEYEYLASLVGLARGGVASAGETARERLDDAGVPGLVDLAERTYHVPYGTVRRVRVYDSNVARPKVAVDVRDGAPYAYRVHAPVDVAALTGALESLGERRDFAVDARSGTGFSPRNSLRRFLADR